MTGLNKCLKERLMSSAFSSFGTFDSDFELDKSAPAQKISPFAAKTTTRIVSSCFA
jgi:hypothetical protein